MARQQAQRALWPEWAQLRPLRRRRLGLREQPQQLARRDAREADEHQRQCDVEGEVEQHHLLVHLPHLVNKLQPQRSKPRQQRNNHRQQHSNHQQRLKCAFDDKSLLNPGKVFPTLHRCAELGRMHVHAGRVAFPDLLRF